MEKTVTTYAVSTVTTETVTDLMEVVFLVVPTGFMAIGAKEVNIISILKARKHSQLNTHCYWLIKIT